MGEETRVQMREVKKGVEAVGGIAERYMIRWLGPVGRKISSLPTRAGRLMALFGIVALVVSLVLIFADALTIWSAVKKRHHYIYFRYEMKGYGIMLLAGVGLFIAGILQKRR